MRILFVEDQRVFAEMVASQFLPMHEVVFADSIAAMRSLLAAEHGFAAALVDYDLPDGKGTDAIRHLRASGFAGVIVAVSAKDDGNAELRAAGAHAVCKKADLRQIGAVLEQLA